MATVTKPIALDESLNTTELSSRNVADVLAQELSAVATAIGGISAPSAEDVSYDNSGSGLSATDVQNAIDELSSEKVDKEVGKGLSTNDYTTAEKTKLAGIEAGAEVNPTSSAKTATESFETVDGGLLSKCQINLVPVQSGSGDPSPDNVRPISGHTEVDLYNVGKNLLEIKNYSRTHNDVAYTVNTDGSIKAYGTPSGTSYFTLTNDQNSLAPSNTTPFKAGDTIIVSTGGSSRLQARLSNGTYYTLANSTPITLTQDIAVIYVQYNGSEVNETIYPMIRKVGSTSDFEPYLGHLYTINLGGTYYGGYLDVVSGEFVATHGYKDLGTIAESSWGRATDHTYNFFYCSVNALPSAPDTSQAEIIGLCSTFKVLQNMTLVSFSDTDWGDNTLSFVLKNQGTQRILIRCDSITTTSGLVTALNGVQLAYKLATPTTIQLTPQQVETLVGQNNLSTPLGGQSLETNGTEYKELFTFADVKELIAEKVPDAPTTDGTYTLQAVVSGGVPTYSWV